MNYDKLSRALRYYYDKNIMTKAITLNTFSIDTGDFSGQWQKIRLQIRFRRVEPGLSECGKC